MKEILSNKTYKDYSYNCRYITVPEYFHNVDQKYVSGTTSHLIENNTYVYHTIKKNETLDSISLVYYNSPLYFWVIADFNKIQDPLIELTTGQKLKIPTLSNIQFEGDL